MEMISKPSFTNSRATGITASLSASLTLTKTFPFFGSGGGARLAEDTHLPLLGQIPLDIATREAGDRGKPIAAEDPNSVVGAEFNRIARELLAKLNQPGDRSPVVSHFQRTALETRIG